MSSKSITRSFINLSHTISKRISTGPSVCKFVSHGNRESAQRRFNSSESTRTKLPVHLPSTGAVNLTDYRGLLALQGPDAAKFLQGLITKIFPSETEPHGLFTSFLSPQVIDRVTMDPLITRDEYCLIRLYTLHPPLYLELNPRILHRYTSLTLKNHSFQI